LQKKIEAWIIREQGTAKGLNVGRPEVGDTKTAEAAVAWACVNVLGMYYAGPRLETGPARDLPAFAARLEADAKRIEKINKSPLVNPGQRALTAILIGGRNLDEMEALADVLDDRRRAGGADPRLPQAEQMTVYRGLPQMLLEYAGWLRAEARRKPRGADVIAFSELFLVRTLRRLGAPKPYAVAARILRALAPETCGNLTPGALRKRCDRAAKMGVRVRNDFAPLFKSV
jgi:hypothetical protein